MPRINAATVGAFTLTLSLAAIPSAVADSDGNGRLTVAPGSVPPGARVKLSTVNPELDDGASVRSEAFVGAVELKSTGKVSLEAHARIRCDAEPGTYTVRFAEPVHPGEDTAAGKVTVEAGGPADGSKCVDAAQDDDEESNTTTVVAVGAGAVAVAAAGAFLVVRRRRRS
ncbi:hypothetical protein [Streptomyces sp. NPDC127108]|uniref:hypothetical protein n=1 Tax=Streptomyces sp. NPDC127108 TaxID=3345361 RepID=UPI00363A654A